jgi:Predicted membrane protein (DUF2079)
MTTRSLHPTLSSEELPRRDGDPDNQAPDSPVPPPPRADDERFERALRVVWVVLGIQLLVLLLWSALLYSRWANTEDYALRYQAWWQIAHGTINPYVSAANHYFWQDHFELVNWPLAPLSRLWPGGLWPLWIQSLMVVGGEAGAVLLVADAVRRPRWPARFPGWMAVALVTLLLVVNPWIYTSVSFDFHYQSVGAACFAMLACREMVRGSRRWLALWVVLCLACGDIAGTYLAAVGLGGVILSRATRRRGAVLLGLGVAWFVVVSAIGGNVGSGIAGHYSYLVPSSKQGAPVAVGKLANGILSRPHAVLSRLWQGRNDVWAYVSSSGGIGILTPLATLPLLILFESDLGQGGSLRAIAYENFGALLFLAPLSVLALGWLARQLHDGWLSGKLPREGAGWLRSPALPRVVAVALAVNALLWAVVWLPQVPGQWLRTSPAAASTLDQVEQTIPADAEVIGSQGVLGRLCGRQWCFPIQGDRHEAYPLLTSATYVVVVPYQGIETSSTAFQLSMIGELAGPDHAHLLLARDGVWLFRIRRTSPGQQITFARSDIQPAWAIQTATGRPDLGGPSAFWHMALTKAHPGYVVYGSDWDLLPGAYRATVTVSTTIPTSVEMWDATTNQLLARTVEPPTDGRSVVQTDFTVTDVGGLRPYAGWGPFAYLPQPPPNPADRIEVRVWARGTGGVGVYTVEVQPVRST